MSSSAAVYSQNVVGYVNVVCPANAVALISNPLNLDGVNCVTNIFANVPKGTIVQIWNGAGYDGMSRSLIGAGAWSANAATNFIPPGKGFFIKTPSLFTNTFVGSVIPAVGGTNSLATLANTVLLVGSPLPVSGTVTNAVDQGVGALNLANMPKGTIIQIWNGSGYTGISRSLIGAGVWSANPTISLAQGFFIKTPVATNWVQSLP